MAVKNIIRTSDVPLPSPLPLSVVIPTLNAKVFLCAAIGALGAVAEIIVADGGSVDDTCSAAVALGARVVIAPRGRGNQLAAGIAAARSDWLLLLHADTVLSPGWRDTVRVLMQAGTAQAAYFRFRLDTDLPQARRLERAVAWRCRWLALPYGDQGLLIHRSLLGQVGGLRPLPLMEDVDLVRRLGRERLVVLDADATTSAAKWLRDGWYKRSARNLLCLALWFLGVPPRAILWLYS